MCQQNLGLPETYRIFQDQPNFLFRAAKRIVENPQPRHVAEYGVPFVQKVAARLRVNGDLN